MPKILNTLFPLALGVLMGAAAATAYTASAAQPAFPETVTSPKPSGWSLIIERDTGDQYVVDSGMSLMDCFDAADKVSERNELVWCENADHPDNPARNA